MDMNRERAKAVSIPPVKAFPDAEASKAQAVKVLEEAAEVLGAFQQFDFWRGAGIIDDYPDIDLEGTLDTYEIPLVEECCDVIQATCNLLAALGVTDLTDAMAACERRNRERGCYGDR